MNKLTRFLAFLAVWAGVFLLDSCQAPVLHSTPGNKVAFQLNLSPPLGQNSQPLTGPSRALLPNETYVTVLAVDSLGTDQQTVSAFIGPSSTTASLALSLISGDTYVVTVNAYTAPGGTLVGTASGTVIAGSSNSATFSLLAPSSTWVPVTSWAPYLDPNIAPNTSFTAHFDMSDALSVSLQLPAPGTGQPVFYFQNENGSVLVPSTSTTVSNGQSGQTTFTVMKTDLAAGSQGFLLTAYNGTTTTMTPGRGTFPYVLDPTKVNTGVYVLDASANVIWEFALNETYGNLTPLGSVPLPTGFTPGKFLSDPGVARVFVVGTLSSSPAIMGYSLSSTGSLTPIFTTPQSSSATFPSGSPLAITSDQNLYWASNGSIYSVPIAANGTFSMTNTTISSGPSIPNYMSYSLGSNLLFLGSMSNGLSVYQPQATGSAALTGSLSGVSFVGGNADILLTDPVLNTVFALIASINTITPYNYGNNPFQINTCPAVSITPPGSLAIDSAGVNLYYAWTSSTGTVTDYSVSTVSGTTYGRLTAGSSFSLPVGGATPRGVATDPLGHYVLTCDSVGDVYSLSFQGGSPAQVSSMTNFALSPNFVDLAVVRAP